jgi:hypothetical protein
MNNAEEKFARYALVHARLHDPQVLRDSLELVPVNLAEALPRVPVREEPKTAMAHAHTSEPDGASSESSARVADTTSAPPNISVEPSSLTYSVSLFQDRAFEVYAPEGQRVELIWQLLNKNVRQSVEMDNKSQMYYQATISLDDGVYLFSYKIDGRMRADSRYAQKLILRPDGVFAFLRLTSQFQTYTIRNLGLVDETLKIESDVAWIVPDPEAHVPAGLAINAIVRLLPQKMVLGHNAGTLRLLAQRENDNSVVAALVRVEAILEAGGAVPEIQLHPTEFGWIMQGKEHLEVLVEVTARGSGSLAGMIVLPHSGEVADFQLEAGGEQARFYKSFLVDSANLPYNQNGALKLTLITDSYLANRKQFSIELPYRLIYLKKSLPALTYGTVRKGSTKTIRLDVSRSDGGVLDLEVVIPESATRYLDAYRARSDAYSFKFDTRELEPGVVVNEMLILTDRLSGLCDHIKVLAEVSSHRTTETMSAVGP